MIMEFTSPQVHKPTVKRPRMSYNCTALLPSNGWGLLRYLVKQMVALIVLTSVLLTSTAVLAAHFNYRVIAPEMTGEDVYYLQVFLQQLGHYQGEINEHYDYDTQLSVKTFQQRYHLPDTGWVDGNTANALLSAVNQEANLVVDGQYQLLSPLPVIANNVLYIPIDIAVPILGIGSEVKNGELSLRYRSEIWPITIAGDDGLPTLDPGGRPTAREWHGTLYLPLRNLATWLGASVNWDSDTRTAAVELPSSHRPYHASGAHFLRRVSSISYHDRVRLIFNLSSTIKESYTPRGLTSDPFSGQWVGQLDHITMAMEDYELALNDPTISRVRLHQVKGSLMLTVTPSDGQQIADCEWLLDPEHDRLILDLYRAQ